MDKVKSNLKCYNPASEKCKNCSLLPINNCEQNVLIINPKESELRTAKQLGVDLTGNNNKINGFINNFKIGVNNFNGFINNFRNSKILTNQHGNSGLILRDSQDKQVIQGELELKNLKKQEDAVYPDKKLMEAEDKKFLEEVYPRFKQPALDKATNICYNIIEGGEK